MLNSAASRILRAGKEEVRNNFGYVWANLWTLVPIGAAFLIATVAANVVSIPSSCASTTATTNWILCRTDANPIDRLTRPNWDLVNATVQRLPPRLEWELAHPVPFKRGAAHGADSTASADSPGNETTAAALMRYPGVRRAVVLAARESTARLTWAVAYGVLIATGIIASIAALMFIVQAVSGQRRALAGSGAVPAPVSALAAPTGQQTEGTGPAPPPASAPPVPPSTRRSVIRASVTYNYLSFLAIAGALALLAVVFDYLLLRFWFGDNTVGAFSILGALNSKLPMFNDEVTQSLALAIPNVDDFISSGSKLLAVAVVLIAIQVASSLYQSPGDYDFRNTKLPDDPRNAFYLRYLGRSFDRLKAAIYLGAGLLVVTLAEIGAQFSWALSMLPPDSTEHPSGLNDALATFGQTMTTEIGFAFSLFLAALYFPAILIIQERARDFYRARNPDRSLQDQNDFLEANGLSFRVSQAYSDFLALLAPVAASSAAALFKVLQH